MGSVSAMNKIFLAIAGRFKLRTILAVFFGFIVILSTTSTGIISYSILERYASKVVDKSIHDTLISALNNIDGRLKQFDNLNYNVLSNPFLARMLEKPYMPGIDEYELNKEFREDIYPGIYGNLAQYIDSVYIFGRNGIFLFSAPNALEKSRELDEIEKNSVIMAAKNAGGKMVWFPTQGDTFLDSQISVNKVITGSRMLRVWNSRYTSQEAFWGYQVINLKVDILREVYVNILSPMDGESFIISGEGRIIFHPQENNISNFVSHDIMEGIAKGSKGSFEVIRQSVSNTVYYNTSTYTGWKIIYVARYGILSKAVEPLKATLIFIILLNSSIAFCMSVIIAAMVTNPLKRMLGKISQVRKGQLEIKLAEGGSIEIMNLCSTFNEMVSDIRRLMEKVREDEQELRKLELNALQAKINPHFLYNTLDSIFWLSKTGENKDAADMTQALSQFFRLGLNKGEDKTTVINEIYHMENYLKIQQIRYKGKFNYEIEFDDNVCQAECIPMILQPVVENSILHGFGRRNGCKLKIRAFLQGKNIRLIVQDNGEGFDVESMTELLQNSGDTKKGYGLRNVDRRIKLNYGEQYGLSFLNAPEGGAQVEILLPFRTKEDGVHV